jgi:hypothetical protein
MDRNKIHRDRITSIVKSFKTKYDEGFTWNEIQSISEKFTSLNRDKFESALFGITCRMINEETVIYSWDVVKALRCGLENRNLRGYEWD